MVWCTWAWKSHQNTELSSKRTWISEWRSNKNPTKSSRIVGVICHYFLVRISDKKQSILQHPGISSVWGRLSLHPRALIGGVSQKWQNEWWKYDYDLFHLISLKKHHFKPVASCSNSTVTTTYAWDPLIENLTIPAQLIIYFLFFFGETSTDAPHNGSTGFHLLHISCLGWWSVGSIERICFLLEIFWWLQPIASCMIYLLH